MDDCFEDMHEPLYGFRTKVTLTENSPCELGVTCRGVPEDNPESIQNLSDNFVGPNGATIPESIHLQDNSNPPKSSNYQNSYSVLESSTSSTTESYDFISDNYNENVIERQTGEDFTSDGPPDCRVIFDPNQCRRI